MKQELETESSLSKDDLIAIKEWINQEDNPTPKIILDIIEAMLAMCLDAQGALKSNKKLVALLRQHMGFIPTKERNDKNKMEPEIWNPKQESKLHLRMRKATDDWKRYKEKKPRKEKIIAPIKNESQNPSPDARVIGEGIFQPVSPELVNKNQECSVNPDDIPNHLHAPVKSYQKRTRFDLAVTLTQTTYIVETISDPVTGFSKTAKVDAGPAKYRVTWETLAQIVLLVAGMGVPMTRLASSLHVTVPYFNPSRIYRLCLFVSKAFLSVYIEIFKQLSTCDIISGDDTTNKVLEMKTDTPSLTEQEIEDKRAALLASKNETDPQKADLLAEAEEYLGGQVSTKNGKGLKKSIFTSVVIGERRSMGPKGTLVFYHSERKSFGDVLGRILVNRSKNKVKSDKKRPVAIQSDLSTQNIPTQLPVDVPLMFFGCAAHARRPFWRYRKDQDPIVGYYCYTMLLLFDKIFDSDRDVRANGNAHEILAARANEQYSLWNEIKIQCEAMLTELAPNSEMGEAGKYVIKNFAKLTAYLSDPRLRPDNNLAERLLRFEKIMLDNSKFRATKKGRLSYDILRTVLSTCTAAGVEPFPYLVHVLRNSHDARVNPAQYTPYAYATRPK